MWPSPKKGVAYLWNSIYWLTNVVFVPASNIHFQKEEGLKFTFKQKESVIKWINAIIKKEGKKCGELLYFFCSDKYLLTINRNFLKHDTYTDIITFDYSAPAGISGEIYISVERVKENAAKFNEAFDRELRRTIIHGVLHLCGYKDKTAAAKKQMRAKEDEALKLFISN